MIANYEDIIKSADVSFLVKPVKATSFDFYWHYNTCFELTLITSGSGRRYVGDDISEFGPGDFVLLGPGLPHTWVSFDDQNVCEAVVVHFYEQPGQINIFALPEMAAVREMLSAASQGILFQGKAVNEIGRRLTKLDSRGNWKTLSELLEILGKLAECGNKKSLSAKSSFGSLDRKSQDRFSKASEYIDANFTDPQISQTQIAAQIHMSPSRFSQFFRQVSGKSYIEYLNELRIGYTCKLLIETDKPITDIAFTAGFGNIANFNRHFLRLKNKTPRQYRNAFTRIETKPYN